MLWLRSRMCSCTGPWLLSPNISQKNSDELQNSGSGMDSQPALCLILSLGIKLYLNLLHYCVSNAPDLLCLSLCTGSPEGGQRQPKHVPENKPTAQPLNVIASLSS